MNTADVAAAAARDDRAAEGAQVTVTDLAGPDFDAACASLGLPGHAADRGRAEDVRALAAALTNPPEILVNSAGGVCGQTARPVEEVPEPDRRTIFAANVDSAFHLTARFAPAMKAAGRGRIVTISSGAGLRASRTDIQAYAAAKHALVGLTRQVVQELGPFGITVNSVAPGFVLSKPASRAQWNGYAPERQAAILGGTHLRRLGEPADIAGAVAFLAGPDAGWITGQVLSVDGGHG